MVYLTWYFLWLCWCYEEIYRHKLHYVLVTCHVSCIQSIKKKKIIGHLSRGRKFVDIYCTFKHCNALPIAVKYAIKISSGTRELSHEVIICKSLPNSVKLIIYNYNTITTSVILSACINELHYTEVIKPIFYTYPYFKVSVTVLLPQR